jgi:hypothetical protein
LLLLGLQLLHLPEYLLCRLRLHLLCRQLRLRHLDHRHLVEMLRNNLQRDLD